jgi:hypothetical protein
MSLKRRDFLKFVSLAGLASQTGLLTSCSHQKFFNPDQDIVFGGGKFKQNEALRHVLAIANIQQQEQQLIDLNFLAHGIIIDPNNKNRLLAFEKNGAHAAATDLTSKLSIQSVQPSHNRQFNGHAAFNKKGSALFCTETSLKDDTGFISIRDGKTLNVIGEFSSHGKNPHECLLINDDVIVVSNTGSTKLNESPASIVYIDVQSGKLIERIMINTPELNNTQLNAGHFAIADDGSLIVASAPTTIQQKTTAEKSLGGVSIRSKKHSIQLMTQPETVINKLYGEALSVVIDNKHRLAAVTHPDANLLTFWSIDKQELIKAISVPQPRGVTLSLDGHSFIVSYNSDTSIVRIDTKSLNADVDSIIQPSYISGAHIYNWSKTLRQIMPTDVYT